MTANTTPVPTYPSRKAYEAAVKHGLIRQGKHPIKARYDRAGNCLICGECGRCPGYHERKEAG